MRYIIEAANNIGKKTLNEMISGGDFKLINSYDPIENLSSKVEKLGLALREFKASGINWVVFKYYLRGRGLSDKLVDNVMGKVEDFFKEVGLEIK